MAAVRRPLLALLALAVLAGACSGDDGGAAAPSTTAGSTTTTESGPTPEDLVASLCAAEPVRPRVRVADPELVELSGLVGFGGMLVAHNDSGDRARLFVLADDGTTREVLEVPAEAVDWEDIAATDDALFVGDIGDNEAQRPSVTVYRVTRLADGVETQPITLRYPEGSRDAEALLADPVTQDLVIVQKRYGGRVGVFVAPESDWSDGDATLAEVGTVVPGTGPLDAVTAGDVGFDGRVVGLRTYDGVLVWPRDEGQSVAEALIGNPPCSAPTAVEQQGESLAFTADGYVTASEGEHPVLHRFRAVASG